MQVRYTTDNCHWYCIFSETEAVSVFPGGKELGPCINTVQAELGLGKPECTEAEFIEALEAAQATIRRAAGLDRQATVNLCDTCSKHIATCDGNPKFGTGKGNDNVYECDGFSNNKAGL